MSATPKRVTLSDEDRGRMQRLSEEVQGRLREMGLIMTRSLELGDRSDAVLKFLPMERAADQGGGTTIEIVCTPEGCGCYVDPPGLCEFPCGAAGPL
ncbi:MAG: hypothetical protein ABI808_13395 [Pseudonocardiales bacterium]